MRFDFEIINANLDDLRMGYIISGNLVRLILHLLESHYVQLHDKLLYPAVLSKEFSNNHEDFLQSSD
jgi:hypothetical protein